MSHQPVPAQCPSQQLETECEVSFPCCSTWAQHHRPERLYQERSLALNGGIDAVRLQKNLNKQLLKALKAQRILLWLLLQSHKS